MKTWWGIKIRVGRRWASIEVRPSAPWVNWEWMRSLNYPIEYGVGVAITRHPMEW